MLTKTLDVPALRNCLGFLVVALLSSYGKFNYTLLICRSRAKMIGKSMTKEEKSMIKVAAEAPEQFDSIENIKASAKEAAEWIKTAKHLVAFTGNYLHLST